MLRGYSLVFIFNCLIITKYGCHLELHCLFYVDLISKYFFETLCDIFLSWNFPKILQNYFKKFFKMLLKIKHLKYTCKIAYKH